MKINRSALVMENYRVIEAADAASCREALRREDLDLIILDVMLPDGDGIALCREIKKMYDVPVLFLSALGENEDVIAALRAGGDDYLPKPYDIRVLLARVEARLRSANKNKRFVSFGSVRLDTVSMIAYSGERDLLLTYKEFAILLMLGRNAGRTVNKEELTKTCGEIRSRVTETPCIRRCRDSIKSSAMPGRISRCRTEEISATPSRMCEKTAMLTIM